MPRWSRNDQKRLLTLENRLRRQGYISIAGVDEAGRGPLAGPVVTAAVILPSEIIIDGVDDSKKLSPARRIELASLIRSRAYTYSVIEIPPAIIDGINILQATMRGMRLAVQSLEIVPDVVLVDGNSSPFPKYGPKTVPVVKGDTLSFAIAAASILAKTHRDSLMLSLHEMYPYYGFDRNKGYPTKMHKEALNRYGPCRHHRRSFLGSIPARDKMNVRDFQNAGEQETHLENR